MQHQNRRIATGAVLLVAALTVSACSKGSGEEQAGRPNATVEPVKGSSLNRVTLTPLAARRLGIRTAPVRERGAHHRTVVPYGAVVYNADGSTFTYTSPRPLVYVRAPITVLRITGAEAILSKGPRPGTRVVSVGSQELYGSEHSVEED